MAKIQGPECPKCECPDTEVIGARLVFGERRERCECDFCGHVFTVEGLVAVEEGGAARAESAAEEAPAEAEPRTGIVEYRDQPAKCVCPRCKARNPRVTRTTKAEATVLRDHKCQCGHRFRSTQANQ